MKQNDIIQHGGLPYIVTEIKTNYDPYLAYCKHYTARCIVNGNEIGGAITECPNPFQNISGVLNRTVESMYA